MNTTTPLKEEHQLILKAIDAITKIKPESERFLPAAEQFLDFVRNFADKFHHGKEEDILFREFGKEGVLSHCNPVPQMLFEHEEGRKFVALVASGLEGKDAALVKKGISGYAALLKEHIFKEDNILYPMGEEGLSDEQKALIFADYEAVEAKLGGDAFRQKYIALVESLTAG